MALLRERLRRNRDWLTIRALGVGAAELRPRRHRHFKSMVRSHSHRRRGDVIDRKQFHNLKGRALRLNPYHVRRALYALDLLGGVIDV